MLWAILNPVNLLVFLVTLLAVWLINTIFRRMRLPPGPFPFPVSGNLFQVRQFKSMVPHVKYAHQKYGKIFHLKLGPNYMVHLCDIKLIKEAFVKKGSVFSHRPMRHLPAPSYTIKHFGHGLANNDGPQWKELRKLSLTAMRDLGVGKTSLEQKIHEEIGLILSYIGQQNGGPHCYKPLMVKSTSNVICNIVFGDRFDYEDPRFIHLLDHVNKVFGMSSGGLGSVVNFLPFLQPFTIALFGPGPGFNAMKATLDHVKELSEDHEASFDTNSIRDFVDLMISYKTNKGGKSVDDQNLRRVIVDLFLAGSDTTANALYWGLLYMAAYPNVQDKCQEEIDSVVGKSRPVSLSDKPDLKYVEATILEILRMGIVAPFSLPHYTTEDVELAGYLIPKHTIVQADIAEVCRDPELWSEPETFNPGRFLDEKNNLVNKELVINFSVGPRSCVGESLAKMELSLIFPSILQHFRVTPGSKDTPVDLEAYQGITTQGKNQNLVLIKR